MPYGLLFRPGGGFKWVLFILILEVSDGERWAGGGEGELLGVNSAAAPNPC